MKEQLNEEWVRRYQKGNIIDDDNYGLSLHIFSTVLDILQIKSLVEALKIDNKIKCLYLNDANLDEKGIKIVFEELNEFHISALFIAKISIKEENLNLLAETLKKNTSLELLALDNCDITNTGALTLLKGLKTSCIKKLSLSSNPITWDSNNITDLLADAFNENTALRTLDLSSCRITDIGALALFKAMKICRITQLGLANNAITLSNSDVFQKALENNTLKKLNLLVNPIQPYYLEDIVRFSLKPNTTLIELKLYYIDHNLIHAAREIQRKADALVSRNKTYLKSHQKINRCLGSAKKILSANTHHSTSTNSSSTESENSLEETGKHLGEALDEALKLYYAIPRYLHAEKLLHLVYVAMGMVYGKYGNYAALIALYFYHFILYPDPAIDKQLADLLSKLEDRTYQSAGLTSKDMEKLYVSLSTNKDTVTPDTLFAKALQASEIPKQKLLKKLFVTPFHRAIQNNPDCFKQDPISFLQIVNALSPFEINLIFANATNAEITEYFGYLKNAWQSEEEKTEFLYNFSTANWIRFLNQLDLETLSTFTLATLGKKSGELRDALADWLIIKLKSPSPEFLAFAQKQKLFAIPHLSNLITKDNEIEKQLIEYGAFMAKLGIKIQEYEWIYSDKDDLEGFQAELAKLENDKASFFSLHPWLRLLYDEFAFPIDLIPTLGELLSLLYNGHDHFNLIKAYLQAAKCLLQVFTIDKFVKKYDEIRMFSKEYISLNISITLEEVRQLSQILKSDTSLLKLTFSIHSTTKLFFLAEGLKTNTTLQQLNLSRSILNEKSATILAELLKKNQTICELNLSHSNLSNSAVEILADALKTNTGIKNLILDNSELGNTGVTLLAKAFENAVIPTTAVIPSDSEESPRLTELSLAKNGIGSEGAKALAKALKDSERKLDSLDLRNNDLTVKDAEIFSEILSKDNLLAFKQKLKLENDKKFFERLNQNNNYHALCMKSQAIKNSTVRTNGWPGQDVVKNQGKRRAINVIMYEIYDYASYESDFIQSGDLQNIYNLIKDQENIICASTRSDYCLTWFPRGKVDSVPLFNEIIKLFQEYDSDLEINYRENITPEDVKENNNMITLEV